MQPWRQAVVVGAAAETEEENRRRAAASGIPVTLQRIKAMIEAR